MTVHHHTPAAAVEPSETRPAPTPTSSGFADCVLRGTLLQRVRAMLHVLTQPHELETVHSLNNHMLTDIGLEADAFRCDMPRHSWQH